MKLRETTPGDIVVVREDSALTMLYVGALLGMMTGKSKKTKTIDNVIVHEVEYETFRILPRSARGADPELEVVAVVETMARRLLLRRRRTREADGSEGESIDPMSMKKKGGTW